jgi:RNA polymerase sigma-70 factor (ECF subfamily)
MDAVARLVQRYQDVAFRVAFLIAGDAEEAKDAAQSAFIKAYFALSRFRREEPFRPWLLRIVANEAKNRRAAVSRRPIASLDAVDAPSFPSTERSPEEIALSEDERRELTAHLDALDERDRTVIVFRYFADLSEEEMAVALGIPKGTVKSRLSRAMTKLRTRINAERQADRERS